MKDNKAEEGVFLVGQESKITQKMKFDFSSETVKVTDVYHGHSNSVRNINVSKDGRMVLTSCEDHSLRIWDYYECKPLLIFSGHHDLVVSFSYTLA